jgi:hypothetical protein
MSKCRFGGDNTLSCANKFLGKKCPFLEYLLNMKYIITESQLKTIMMEQPESRFAPRGLSSKENMDALSGKYEKNKLGPNLGIDDYTDIISGLIDAIPGIGNLISAGIDITHGLTYVARYFFAETIEEKLEMGIMAMVTFGTTLIPIGGNATNIVAKGEIKSLMKKTPYELRSIMKEMGLLKSVGVNLSKQPWKYSFLIALVKIFRSKVGDVLASVSNTLAKLSNNSKELKPYIDNFNGEIKDLQTMLA